MPTLSGWLPGTVSLPFSEVAIGIPSRSASAISSASAPDVHTPPPAIKTGRSASDNRSTAAAQYFRVGGGAGTVDPRPARWESRHPTLHPQ